MNVIDAFSWLLLFLNGLISDFLFFFKDIHSFSHTNTNVKTYTYAKHTQKIIFDKKTN